MRGPYGLEASESCSTCKLKSNGFFCQLAAPALKDFDEIKFTSAYPKDAVLFMERQEARGVYVLCEGEVKISISSSEGKKVILHIARPGEVLGLTSTLAGTSHEVTAEALRPCQVAFVRRGDFLGFLAKHPETAQGVIRQMGAQYRTACEQIRTLGLSTTVHEKLARLLLDWTSGSEGTKGCSRTKMPLTHEEIAEFIGTTRESVTRTLGDFKSRHLVVVQGSTLTIPNRAALEECVPA